MRNEIEGSIKGNKRPVFRYLEGKTIVKFVSFAGFILLCLTYSLFGIESDPGKFEEVYNEPVVAPGAEKRIIAFTPFSKWETFTKKDGLPSDKVFAVRIQGRRVWIGTTEGLALYENRKWRSFGTKDGLPHSVILSLDASPRTGDLWIGSMGGLARFSGGKFDVFTQLNSGLPNNFVNAVRCDPYEDSVWVATAMGAAKLDLKSGEWSIYTHLNTPMHEPWTYALAISRDNVYVGAWGGGILEYNKKTGNWREYRDPDKEFEIDLFPDDGPVSDVTSSIDYGSGNLWQATYTGADKYDGRNWSGFISKKTGLASDFVNFVRAQGQIAWFATDQGLSQTDGINWITYVRLQSGGGRIRFFQNGKQVKKQDTESAIAHNYVLGVDADENQVWVATGGGVSRGMRTASDDEISRTAEYEPVTLETNSHSERRFSYADTPEPLQPFREYVPYKTFFTEKAKFLGPADFDPQKELDDIRIGMIGPFTEQMGITGPALTSAGNEQTIKFGESMFRGATLAIEDANRHGGYMGAPFRIVPRTDLVLWGQTSDELVKFALDDHVWAVLSGIDSNHNHVLTRATLKMEVPLVNVGVTDPTLVEHVVPWLMRCMIDDRQNAYALLDEILVRKKLTRLAILRVNDRDGRVGIAEFIQGARRMGHPVLIEQRFTNGDTDFKDQLMRIKTILPDALVIWGNPREAGLIVRQMRELKMGVPIYGFSRMAHKIFLATAKEAAEGVTVVASMDPESHNPLWTNFVRQYKERWGEFPDQFAAYSFDGMNIIIKAIRSAGLSRTQIRDVLFRFNSYKGVTGDILFDTNQSNIALPWMATVHNGHFKYRRVPHWSQSGDS